MSKGRMKLSCWPHPHPVKPSDYHVSGSFQYAIGQTKHQIWEGQGQKQSAKCIVFWGKSCLDSARMYTEPRWRFNKDLRDDCPMPDDIAIETEHWRCIKQLPQSTLFLSLCQEGVKTQWRNFVTCHIRKRMVMCMNLQWPLRVCRLWQIKALNQF